MTSCNNQDRSQTMGQKVAMIFQNRASRVKTMPRAAAAHDEVILQSGRKVVIFGIVVIVVVAVDDKIHPRDEARGVTDFEA